MLSRQCAQRLILLESGSQRCRRLLDSPGRGSHPLRARARAACCQLPTASCQRAAVFASAAAQCECVFNLKTEQSGDPIPRGFAIASLVLRFRVRIRAHTALNRTRPLFAGSSEVMRRPVESPISVPASACSSAANGKTLARIRLRTEGRRAHSDANSSFAFECATDSFVVRAGTALALALAGA